MYITHDVRMCDILWTFDNHYSCAIVWVSSSDVVAPLELVQISDVVVAIVWVSNSDVVASLEWVQISDVVSSLLPLSIHNRELCRR